MIKNQTYNLKHVLLTNELLDAYINNFWNDVFSSIGSDKHLLLMCKVQYSEAELGYRTLGHLRKVNIEDKELFIEYLSERLGIFNDAYVTLAISKITFSYVIKTTGFSFDNILAGLAGIGHNYLEIITNFTKKLFFWFVELFDHKIIPNVPNPGTGGSGGQIDKVSKDWFDGWKSKGESVSNRPILDRMLDKSNSLRESYINININPTPWYKDLSTWMWIGGAIGLLSVGYLGYKLIYDPSYFIDFGGKGKGVDPSITGLSGNAGPSVVISPSTDGSITPTGGSKSLTKSLISLVSNVKNKINPLNWFMASEISYEEARKALVDRQMNYNIMNKHIYPFTPVDPNLSWFKRGLIHYFGESNVRVSQRMSDLREVNALYESIRVRNPIISAPGTPSIGTIGLGDLRAGPSSNSLIGAVESTIAAAESWNKVNSLPPTPSTIPLTNLPDVDASSIPQGSWDTHIKESPNSSPSSPVEEFTKAVKTTYSAVVKSKPLPTSNKFDVLDSDSSVLEELKYY
jgi:hypothetical protein